MGRMVAGRMMVGQFIEVAQRTKKVRLEGQDVDQPIRGLFEIRLLVPNEDEPQVLRASFFSTQLGDSLTRMQVTLDALQPQKGEWLAVRISSRAKTWKPDDGSVKAVLNEDALSCHRLAELGDGVTEANAAPANGTTRAAAAAAGLRPAGS